MAGDIKLNESGVQIEGNLVATTGIWSTELHNCKLFPSFIWGNKGMGTNSKRTLPLYAEDLVLQNRTLDASGSTKPAYPDDDITIPNIALSHGAGNILIVNRGGGYTGGVRFEGAVSVGGKDVAGELAALRKELSDLRTQIRAHIPNFGRGL